MYHSTLGLREIQKKKKSEVSAQDWTGCGGCAPDRLVFKAHRLLYLSSLGLRVIKKRKKKTGYASAAGGTAPVWGYNPG